MKVQWLPCRLLSLLLLVAPVMCALSAETTHLVTPDTLNAKIREVAANTDLDEATRSKLTALYQQALGFLETAQASQAASDAFRAARQSADAEARQIREKIENVASTAAGDELEVSAQTPLADIEQLLLKEKANRAAVAAKLSALADSLAVEADRPTAVREEISRLTRRKDARAAEIAVPVPANESPLLAIARSWLSQSEGKALGAQLQMLDQELLSQPMRVALLKALRDQSALSIERIDIRIKQLEQMLSTMRLSEAEQAKTETVQAVRDAQGKHPLVQGLAERNAALSEELGALATELEQIRADEMSASQETKRLEDNLRSTKKKLEFAGISQVLGLVLLEQRLKLPDVRQISRKARELEARISHTHLRLIQDEEEQQQLQNLVDYINGLTEKLTARQIESIRSELQGLAEARRELLDKTIATRLVFMRDLGELDVTQRHLMDAVQISDQFLAEHLLWVRSAPAPSLSMVLALPQQMVPLLAGDNWREVLGILAVEFARSPVLILGLALFCVLLWKRTAMRAALLASAGKVGKVTTDRFAFSIQALLYTLLLAAPWPLLSVITGSPLENSAAASDFAGAVGSALIWVAKAWFFLTFFHVLCTPGGLATGHFHWPEPSVRRLRRGLTRLKLTMLPAAFVALFIMYYELTTVGGGLARLAIVIMQVMLAIFFYRLFEPQRGVLRPYLEQHPRGALARLRYLWLALTVVLPLTLASMAVIGFMYTAGTLTSSLIDSMWLLLSLLVTQQMVIRWLLLTRGRLALQASIERREAARARQAAEASLQPGSEPFSEQLEEPVVDLDALSLESRKLLNMVLDMIGIIGVWLIWSKMLPAFNVLDDITLWHSTALVAGQEQLLPVTLADAGLAVVIAVVTVLLTKRFPALLEISLLQRLNMSPGGRYAATTLSRYTIAVIGTMLALSTIGARWSQIQWLVAALGVGIGFGLQEIVANFISGIIILFERPIRVGDTVTVADTDGIVTRIQIRATTIRNWDGKELLVPNKEFITARLLNWTLSDPLTRIVIPVGLAYGGDVTKAMSLLLKAANDNSQVLQDPRASVVFDAFGDNALSLKLRCFVASMDHRIETISELHHDINQKFNDAGLVFAFPQRDVHLDTSRPLDIRVSHEQPGK